MVIKMRVAAKRVEAAGICSFELVAADGNALPPFSAGSHIDVHLAGLVRQYSLCNDPAETHRYMIAVLREENSRGGSAAMHRLEEGHLLEISHPRNHFPLAQGAPHTLLLAGGIGITPILCMAEQLAVAGSSFSLHYFTRSAERTAFIERMRQSRFSEAVHLHHDDAPVGQQVDPRALIAGQPAGTHLYACGPGGFMEAMLSHARSAGWPEERLHREYFSAPAAAPQQSGEFEVQVASTGQVVRVAADVSVVTALAAAGIDIPTSCEQGVCGTCLTRVIEGMPEHHDCYLTPEEQSRNDQFTPCCSRALSGRLVLDL